MQKSDLAIITTRGQLNHLLQFFFSMFYWFLGSFFGIKDKMKNKRNMYSSKLVITFFLKIQVQNFIPEIVPRFRGNKKRQENLHPSLK